MSDPAKRSGSARRRGTVRKCPICDRPANEDAYPFCSRRCADVDLNRWLSGSYVIPASQAEDEDDEGGR